MCARYIKNDTNFSLMRIERRINVPASRSHFDHYFKRITIRYDIDFALTGNCMYAIYRCVISYLCNTKKSPERDSNGWKPWAIPNELYTTLS